MDGQLTEPTIIKPIPQQVPSLGSFLSGRPEMVLSATKKPKILITWMHPDEELAPRVAHLIYTTRPELAQHIDYICGNPKAAGSVPVKGFCETDLNRSFGIAHEPTSYEEKRAAKILALTKKYDYVLDLHTAVDPTQDHCIIIPDTSLEEPAVLDLIKASPTRRIVAMKRASIATTLIAVSPKTIVMENPQIGQNKAIIDVIELLERLLGIKPRTQIEREFYYVDGTIPKNQDPGLKAENFKLVKSGGYYPVLLGTGPRSYREDPTKDYCCFYAKRKKTVLL